MRWLARAVAVSVAGLLFVPVLLVCGGAASWADAESWNSVVDGMSYSYVVSTDGASNVTGPATVALPSGVASSGHDVRVTVYVDDGAGGYLLSEIATPAYIAARSTVTDTTGWWVPSVDVPSGRSAWVSVTDYGPYDSAGQTANDAGVPDMSWSPYRAGYASPAQLAADVGAGASPSPSPSPSSSSAGPGADPGAVQFVNDAASSTKDTLVGVVAAVLPYAVVVCALVMGWSMWRRYSRSVG